MSTDRHLRTCTCDTCARERAARRKYRVLRRHRGHASRVPADAAIAHLTKLRTTMGWPSIAATVGSSASYLRRIHRGEIPRINELTQRRILAAAPARERDPGLYIDATGAVRRVRALMAIGHSQQAIAEAASTTAARISLLSNGQPVMRQMLATRIRRAYRQLATTPGTSTRARGIAAREGWHSPAAWDGDAIDDPCALPERDTGHDALTQAEARAINGEEMRHLASLGVAEHDIARRLGLGERHVHDTLRNLREAA